MFLNKVKIIIKLELTPDTFLFQCGNSIAKLCEDIITAYL